MWVLTNTKSSVLKFWLLFTYWYSNKKILLILESLYPDLGDTVQQIPNQPPLSDFLLQLEEYTPTIPDAVIKHYLATSGFDTSDPRVLRLLNANGLKKLLDFFRLSSTAQPHNPIFFRLPSCCLQFIAKSSLKSFLTSHCRRRRQVRTP